MRRVRLTEGQLHRIIRNAVNEAIEDDMSGDEDVQQRRDKIVAILHKEGYEVAENDRVPNIFSIKMYEPTYEEEKKDAQQIADRFHVKKFDIWDPMMNYRVGDDGMCDDGGYAPEQCDFYL